MAEDMRFTELPVVTGAMLSDYVVLSLFGGTSARLSVGLFKNVMTEGIRPSVGEDGCWLVGDVPTGILAEGKTPEFRKARTCIEYKYTTDDDSTWRPFIQYDNLRLRYDDLTPAEVDSLRLRYEDLTDWQIKELQKPAQDAMDKLNKEISNQILAIEMDSYGELVAVTGEENPYFDEGNISDTGEIILDFNY